MFGLCSILLSVAIVPLLLSNNRAPDYEVPDRMPVGRLYRVSPMAVLGIVVMSVGVSAWFISLPLYALQQCFSGAQASGVLVIAMIAGAVVQYPIGWWSDNTDRRVVVIALSIVSGVLALVVALFPTPGVIVIGFAVIAGCTLPIYSILAAHANDQLSPGQIVPASGTLAFLLQLAQVFGMLIGPNMIKLADGRGLLFLLIVVGVGVALLGMARRLRGDVVEDTGAAQPMGVLGIAQPGMLQAEALAEDDRETRSP